MCRGEDSVHGGHHQSCRIVDLQGCMYARTSKSLRDELLDARAFNEGVTREHTSTLKGTRTLQHPIKPIQAPLFQAFALTTLGFKRTTKCEKIYRESSFMFKPIPSRESTLVRNTQAAVYLSTTLAFEHSCLTPWDDVVNDEFS